MIQGTSSSSGKTTLVTALCRIFSDEGYVVAPFKSQNMSNYSYKSSLFEISRAQAIQAIAARTEIIPEMNPILLKPLGNYKSKIMLLGKPYKNMNADDYYKKFVLKKGLEIIVDSINHLKKKYDLIIIEGAGSPAEINLVQYDVANMKIAELTKSPVFLITDIERGGSFASLVGTLALLDSKHKKLVKGFIVNKFRGNLDILKPGYKILTKNTGKPVIGTIPYADFSLPEEDSLGSKSKKISLNTKNLKNIDKEINKLAKLIKANLNLSQIRKYVK